MTTIRQISVDELFAHHDAPALLAEYAAESAICGLPTPRPDQAKYQLLERSGALHVLAAFKGDTLLGFIAVIITVNPHYSAVLAVSESFFVGATYRKFGAGLRLRREAENLAASQGAAGIFFSAPTDGRLAEVMEKSSEYRETNRVFFRGLL